MNTDEALFTALAKLPLPQVPSELTARIQREAHAELMQQTKPARPLRSLWIELVAAAVVFGVGVLHAGWAVTFVAALYR